MRTLCALVAGLVLLGVGAPASDAQVVRTRTVTKTRVVRARGVNRARARARVRTRVIVNPAFAVANAAFVSSYAPSVAFVPSFVASYAPAFVQTAVEAVPAAPAAQVTVAPAAVPAAPAVLPAAPAPAPIATGCASSAAAGYVDPTYFNSAFGAAVRIRTVTRGYGFATPFAVAVPSFHAFGFPFVSVNVGHNFGVHVGHRF